MLANLARYSMIPSRYMFGKMMMPSSINPRTLMVASSSSSPSFKLDEKFDHHHQHNNNCTTTIMYNYESRRYGRRYRRWHHWPNDFLPFEWSRPVVDPPYLRTGDAINDIGHWNATDLIPGAEYATALKDAPEPVRRLFSLGFAERSTVVEHQRRKIVQAVQRHPLDSQSPEVLIAQYTIKIRNNLRHFLKIDKYDAPRKIRQEIMKNRRAKLLKELYYQDSERYHWLVRLLGIKHELPKLGEHYRKPTRKGELRRLTTEYCDTLKQQRLDEYHQELKEKRKTLQDEMDRIAQLIEQEEKFIGTVHNDPRDSK